MYQLTVYTGNDTEILQFDTKQEAQEQATEVLMGAYLLNQMGYNTKEEVVIQRISN